LLSKLNSRRIYGSAAIALILLSVFVALVSIKPINAQAGNNTLPIVAVHVSENTESHWTNVYWTYWAIYASLEETLRSDGTPFVEVNDSVIESGGLLNNGDPKYPILISLAAECISDAVASQVRQYVSSGGFAYVGSSAWTRYSNGTARSNFALSAEMGVTCTAPPPNNWNLDSYIFKNATNRLVDILPTGVNISPWNLPLDNGTSIQNTGGGNPHYFWQAYNTAANPADMFLTIPSSPYPYVMLATKAYSTGRFIYHSEFVPLVGYSIYAPGVYEYYFFRRAIEWAFESRFLPLVRLSPWPYQYDSAFVIRHDLDGGPGFVLSSAQREKELGVTGQYYLITGGVRDDPGNASVISDLQEAQNIYGAQIGPHNGGLNSHYWLGSSPGEYAYYHWGPDISIVRNGTGDYWPYDESGESANPTGLYGKDYANMSIKLALDDLQSWLGQRPVIWVSPWADSCTDDSLELLESQGIKTAGERNFGPFPHIALSLNTKGKHYDILEIPSDTWVTSSGGVYQRLEEHSTATMQQMIDTLYSLGALESAYNHVSSNGGIGEAFITYCQSKPNMWNATPLLIRDWWWQREPVQISPTHRVLADGTHNLTIALAGSTSSDTTVEIAFQADNMNRILNLQVLVDGIPSTNYRTLGTGAIAIKVKTGLGSKVTVTWKQPDAWTQTSQADFESGTRTNLDTSSVSGQVSLAGQSGGSTLFCDYFNDSTWTSSQWTVHSGIWTTGLYKQSGTESAYFWSYAGDSSWSDYTVEARTGGVSGQYFAQMAGRLNITSGTRYALWLYPSVGGPNRANLIKFTGWTTWSSTPLAWATVATDNNYHTLKMAFNGTSIKCYYDGTMIIEYDDVSSPYLTGMIDLETYGTKVNYDWVTVKNLAEDTVIFSDDFNDGSWTNSHWTVNGGTWSVDVEKYLQSDLTGMGPTAYKNTYAGDTSWTDYAVEAEARYISGNYGSQIAARVNPMTGSRYAFWVYPASGGGETPNTLKLIKFTDWTTWTELARATATTDTNWHSLKMELRGSSIRCYYDGTLAMQATDSSYSSGSIGLETSASLVEYDWVTVKTPSTYYSTGTLISSAFDSGYRALWMNMSWTATTPTDTLVKFRTRTAQTVGDLTSAQWSDNYTLSGAAITSPANRWIQYEATLSTTDITASPILYDVSVYYMQVFQVNLTVAVSAHGTTSPVPGVYLLDGGSSQMVTAIPDLGYKLDHWDLDGLDVGNSSSYTVTMNDEHILTAMYASGATILVMSPTNETCRKHNETFTVQINIANAADVDDFEFEIHYNTTLLDVQGILWNAWGSGTYNVDDSNGNLTGYTSGTTISGNFTLLTITFNATYYHIWKIEGSVSGWKNDQTGTIYIQWANLSYASSPDVGYVRGGLNQISVGPDFLYTFSPIKGDLNNNGVVDVFDLRTVAAFYNTVSPTYDLTGDDIIDIFDLVVISTNYGFTYNP
jgi:hypothetical protein